MPKFKVSKYSQTCYNCNRSGKTEFIIVKFNAEAAAFGVGKRNIDISCPRCGRKVPSLIDTWWGGTFGNNDRIFEDTVKGKEIKISRILDYTDTLVKQHFMKLSAEIKRKEKELNDDLSKLKAIEKFMQKNVKRKTKNG